MYKSKKILHFDHVNFQSYFKLDRLFCLFYYKGRIINNLQYSKKVGVERITGNKQIQGQTITQPEPEIKRNTKRSTRKDINYNEN